MKWNVSMVLAGLLLAVVSRQAAGAEPTPAQATRAAQIAAEAARQAESEKLGQEIMDLALKMHYPLGLQGHVLQWVTQELGRRVGGLQGYFPEDDATFFHPIVNQPAHPPRCTR